MRPIFCVLPLLLAACSKSGPMPASSAAAAPATPVAQAALAAPAKGDPVEGFRQAKRVGCAGCHKANGEGTNDLWAVPDRYTIRSANLTVKRELYDDAGLDRLIRQGKTHDGHAPLGMPIFMFQRLSDRETRDIIAWVRSLPPVENPGLKPSWISEKILKQVADGTFEEDDYLPDAGVVAPAEPPTEQVALGEHLAMTSCPECHGRELRSWGVPDSGPNLVVAKAYTPEAFKRLMRTGIAANGKETATGFMSGVARGRFATLTDDEIAALKAFLDARAP